MKVWRYIASWAILVAVFSALLWGALLQVRAETRRKENVTLLEGYRVELESMVSHHWKALETLSANERVIATLSGGAVAEVERLFDAVAGMESADIVYLMNSQGLVVASSTYGENMKLTGNNYRFRPYFKYAMAGRKMVFPAVGVTTQRRGIYMAHPVWGEAMDPVGALIFKLPMEPVDELFQPAPTPVMLLDVSGVVFAASTGRWMYHAVRHVARQEVEPFDYERQFGDRPIKFLEWSVGDREAVVDGVKYQVATVAIPGHKWTLVGLFPTDDMAGLPPGQMRITLVGYLSGVVLITVVLILLGTVSRRLQVERVLTRHRETLEEIVNRRTRQLETVNETLVQELEEKRYAEKRLRETLEEIVNRRTRQLETVNETLVQELEEKRYAEKRLRENEASFKRANRIAGLGSWEWDLVEDRITLSDVMMAIYDSESASLNGRFEEVIQQMVHPEDREKVMQAGRLFAETGTGDPIEYRVVRRDGEVRWVRAEVPEVKAFTRNGEVVSLFGTVQDITERKLGETWLLRLKAAMEQSVDGIAIADLTGAVVFVNSSWAKMHGFRVAELAGVNLDSFHTRTQVEEHLREFQHKVVEYGSCQGEIGHVTRNGREFPTWMSASLMAEQGDAPAGIVWICREISTQKQAEFLLKRAKEEAEAATRAKSAFLANMSHEIRTPMNGVIGMVDILLDTGLTAEQRDYAESVKSSADSLLTLINDILDFSKIEAGKLDIEEIDFNLRTVLEGLSDVMAIKAREKGLDFGCLINDNVPVYLKGDPVRLRQILTNLTGNAVKFVEKGGVMIRVALKETWGLKVRLFFEVVDTGIGIHKEALFRIFDAFSQEDVSTTRKYGGSGLGLSISKQLTRLMRGNIGGESRPGHGTTFWFTVELERQADAPHEWFDRIEALKGMHLLVVDDNAVNRQVFREYARSWGCRVAEVASGAEAIRAVARAGDKGTPFDAAIIDMQMPGMDGEALGRHLKEMETTRAMPLLMATSIGQRGEVVRMREAGFAAYVTKPVRKRELGERLVQILNLNVEGVRSLGTDGGGEGKSVPSETEGPVMRVLLAEDNRMNQRVAVNMLQTMGHTVRVVSNGVEAVTAFAEESFDLILMDGQMPEMDGLEAAAEIRNIEKGRADGGDSHAGHVPIIALTANAMKGDRERFLAAGMDAYIPKPMKKKELEEAIRRVVGSDSSETQRG